MSSPIIDRVCDFRGWKSCRPQGPCLRLTRKQLRSHLNIYTHTWQAYCFCTEGATGMEYRCTLWIIRLDRSRFTKRVSPITNQCDRQPEGFTVGARGTQTLGKSLYPSVENKRILARNTVHLSELQRPPNRNMYGWCIKMELAVRSARKGSEIGNVPNMTSLV